MASSNKTTSSLALFFCLNLLFFSLVTARSPCSEPVPEPTQSPNSVVTLPTDGAPSPTTGKVTCTRSLADIHACTTVLSIVGITFGRSAPQECCSLIQGRSKIEATVCLSNALEFVVKFIGVSIADDVKLILNSCGGKNNAPSN